MDRRFVTGQSTEGFRTCDKIYIDKTGTMTV